MCNTLDGMEQYQGKYVWIPFGFFSASTSVGFWYSKVSLEHFDICFQTGKFRILLAVDSQILYVSCSLISFVIVLCISVHLTKYSAFC